MTLCAHLPNWTQNVENWLFDWQTLIGGLLALGSALWAGALIRRQIDQVEIHHRSELVRKHQAVRATLSLTLSQICKSARDTLRALAAIRVKSTIGRILEEEPKIELQIPDSAVPSLQALLETTSNLDLVSAITELVTRMQVGRARLEDINFDHDHDIDARMIDIAQVHAMSESLIEYARFEVDRPPDRVGWDRVKAALRIVRIWEDNFPQIYKLIDQYSRNRVQFWSTHNDR